MATFNFSEFRTLKQLQNTFKTEADCIKFLEKKLWENGVPVSPFDPTSKVYKRGDGLYRCKNTGKNFNIKKGTFMEGSKIPLTDWFVAIYMLTSDKKGASSIKIASYLGVTQKTAWFMTQRIRQSFKQDLNEKFDGEVELDETFVGGKNKNRHWNKKVKNSQGRSFKDKVPVMGVLQRGGKVFCQVVKNTSYKQLTAPILRKVKRTATLYSDEWCGYKTVNKVYNHHVVDHGHGIYVSGGAYTNTIESFWSNYCKRSINGIYNFISRKHMQKYFDEFCFRYNTRKVSNDKRICELIANCKGTRITYKQLVA